VSRATIRKYDGNFYDPQPRALGLEDRFDLEGIAVRTHADVQQMFERAPSPSAKTRGAVAHGEAGNERNVMVGKATKQTSTPRPVYDAATFAIA